MKEAVKHGSTASNFLPVLLQNLSLLTLCFLFWPDTTAVRFAAGIDSKRYIEWAPTYQAGDQGNNTNIAPEADLTGCGQADQDTTNYNSCYSVKPT